MDLFSFLIVAVIVIWIGVTIYRVLAKNQQNGGTTPISAQYQTRGAHAAQPERPTVQPSTGIGPYDYAPVLAHMTWEDPGYFDLIRAQREEADRQAIVRGQKLWDWIPHIDQLKRDGDLEEALELTYECIDAMERYSAVMGYAAGAAGWYKRAAIILRKMKDYEAEMRLIEDVKRRFPDHDGLEDRIPYTTRMLEKQRREEAERQD